MSQLKKTTRKLLFWKQKSNRRSMSLKKNISLPVEVWQWILSDYAAGIFQKVIVTVFYCYPCFNTQFELFLKVKQFWEFYHKPCKFYDYDEWWHLIKSFVSVLSRTIACQAFGPWCSSCPRFRSWATPSSSSSGNNHSSFCTGNFNGLQQHKAFNCCSLTFSVFLLF